MVPREMMAVFVQAAWRGPEEVEGWLGAVGPVSPADLVKLLEAMPGRPDGERQKARCYAFGKLAERVVDRSLFLPYLKALQAGGSELREVLSPLIPKVANPAQVDALVELLDDGDASLRPMVQEILRRMGGKAVLQALTTRVEKGEGAARMEALETLLQVVGVHALPLLEDLVGRGKPPERLQVLKALGDARYSGKGVAARALAGALRDPNEAVVLQAAASFGVICSEDDLFTHLVPLMESAGASHSLVKAGVEACRRFSSPRVISFLQRRLQAGPNKVRLAVVATLEAVGTEAVLPALVDALSHKHVAVRGAAGEVFVRLSRVGKLDAAPTIVWLLRSKDTNVRRMAAEIAKGVKDPQGQLWPKLVAFIKDEDWWVRERVMDALVGMAGPALARHFLSYLQEPSEVIRRFGVEVLARLKEPSAIPALIQTSANDTDWWVRERAVEALASFQDERMIPHLVSLLKRFPEMHLICLEALTQLKARAAAAHLSPALASEDPEVRLAALRCLEVIGDSSLEAAVKPMAGDPDGRVRAQAALLLTRWNIGIGEVEVESGGVSRLDRFLKTMAEAEADDLILESGNRPFVKRLGKVVPMSPVALTEEQVKAMIVPHLSVAQVEELQALRDIDFSYQVKGDGLRFRANVFRHLGGLSAVFRIIKGTIPEFGSLGLPGVVKGFGDLPNGLVLVGGPTGSGKSTTLAALIDYINTHHAGHIVSLEDPIEVVHRMKKGLVNQREIGTHTKSFARALRSTLRQDPDVILVGEMRDRETIHFAITAADTGHLVFGTVHTVSADTAVDRLVNVFPSDEQEQARASLANSLRAVVCQYLLKKLDGNGRTLASEVLLCNDAVANLIRKGKTFQIPSVIATSKEMGMQSMDSDLLRLWKSGVVSPEEVYLKARNKKEFEFLFPGGTPQAGAGAGKPGEPMAGAASAPAIPPAARAGRLPN